MQLGISYGAEIHFIVQKHIKTLILIDEIYQKYKS